ncbi:MAG: hypothetical protein R3C19_06020 [Planctomycetaceae bacterium]
MPWQSLTGRDRVCVAGLIALHVGLVSYGAAIHSPCIDEIGHFGAGLYHWQTGRLDAYRVNPPMVRMWATLPVSFAVPSVDMSFDEPIDRLEMYIGPAVIQELDPQTIRIGYTVARIFCVPFTILAAAGLLSLGNGIVWQAGRVRSFGSVVLRSQYHRQRSNDHSGHCRHGIRVAGVLPVLEMVRRRIQQRIACSRLRTGVRSGTAEQVHVDSAGCHLSGDVDGSRRFPGRLAEQISTGTPRCGSFSSQR